MSYSAQSPPGVVQPIAVRLSHHISSPRMAPYVASTHTPTQALKLYRWNMKLSGELQQALSLVEVVLRNAIDHELRIWNAAQPPSSRHGVAQYTDEWVKLAAAPLWSLINKPQGNGRPPKTTYGAALSRAQQDMVVRDAAHPRHRAAVCHDDVVAHVTFGTWAKILGTDNRGYWADEMWKQALHAAFPGKAQSPLVVAYWVARLHRLRNRVAHLEPLLGVDVMGYHRTAARLLTSIDPDIGSWYAGTSELARVLERRPA